MKHEIICGDSYTTLRKMDAEVIDTIITSPAYWGLRDYNVEEQIGLEPTLEEYHTKLLAVTKECKRVLKPTGVMFWNHGDSYGGMQGRGTGKGNEHAQMVLQKKAGAKCLTMQNERLIIKMVDEQGWILRNRIIWHKQNGMPSSVTDRFSNKYEPVYMLVKNRSYWFDLDAVRIPAKYQEVWSRKGSGKDTPYDKNNPRKRWGLTKHEIATQRTSGTYSDPLHTKPIHSSGMKNPGDVWTIPTHPYPEAHFATFPTSLIEPMIKVACPAEVCKHCGVARERVTDKEVEFTSGSGKAGNPPKGKYEGSVQATSGSYDIRMGPEVTYHTTGWTDCQCEGEDKYEPGIILDPFGGAGTTAYVAETLRRNSISIELNAEYCKIAHNRLSEEVAQTKFNTKRTTIQKVGF